MRRAAGDVAIAEEAVVAAAPPRAEVQLVDRHRRVQRVARGARAIHGASPQSVVERPDARRRRRRRFVRRRRTDRPCRTRSPSRGDDPVLVRLARAAPPSDAPLPRPGAVGARREPVRLRVPPVPLAEHAHARAFGAQTRNVAPSARRWQPMISCSRACVPSRNRYRSCSPRAAGGGTPARARVRAPVRGVFRRSVRVPGGGTGSPRSPLRGDWLVVVGESWPPGRAAPAPRRPIRGRPAVTFRPRRPGTPRDARRGSGRSHRKGGATWQILQNPRR